MSPSAISRLPPLLGLISVAAGFAALVSPGLTALALVLPMGANAEGLTPKAVPAGR